MLEAMRINGSGRFVDLLRESAFEYLLVGYTDGEDALPDCFNLAHPLLALFNVALRFVVHPETDCSEAYADCLNRVNCLLKPYDCETDNSDALDK